MEIQTLKLKDYKQPAFWAPSIDLTLDIFEGKTVVTSKVELVKNSSVEGHDLFLAGDELKFVSLRVDGREHKFDVSDKGVELFDLPEKCTVQIVNEIVPENNKALEGFYKTASGFYCSQCEAEGFRRITYFLDRPDVMAKYRTTLIADKNSYPVLLSNGNKVEAQDLENGRHSVVWEDPFPKPSYLFAAVAGDLDVVSDKFTTQSNRVVKLEIFTDKGRSDRTGWAMQSLKQSMQWDEQTYGLEYDLDIYMIVAVDDFNMGAMENKGLNIFNSRCVLASEDSATDMDFEKIESIIGHEYFHNWSGNRVTCRDWFQLSLKEGLTVYRDQEFTSDMTSRNVKRIKDVRTLRAGQFVEDAGPNAHPVRPQSCVSVDNFYTNTIYDKGAELIRMLATIVGEDDFKKSLNLYFARFDGQAVTTEDFVRCVQEASDKDLSQFQNWYDQAGTPEVEIQSDRDDTGKVKALTFKQSCRDTPETQVKKPFLIPVKMGFISAEGKAVPFTIQGKQYQESAVICLEESSATFDVEINEPAIPSFFRELSAPVRYNYSYTDADLLLLMADDSDMFNRWDSFQKLCLKRILKAISSVDVVTQDAAFLDAFEGTLKSWSVDPLFCVEMLSLPSTSYVYQFLDEIDPVKVDQVWQKMALDIADRYESDFKNIYKEICQILSDDPKTENAVGLRSLRGKILWYLNLLGNAEYLTLAKELFEGSQNMTETTSALHAMNFYENSERAPSLEKFYDKWKLDTVVINKWLTFKALWEDEEGVSWLENLQSERHFDILNPNNVYASYCVFVASNLKFHDLSGSGYAFICDIALQIDPKNPQVAARIFEGFLLWNKFEPKRRELMKRQLERAIEVPNLSKNSLEILSKALAQ